MNKSSILCPKIISSIIGIVAVIVVMMLSDNEVSSRTSSVVGCLPWHECTLSMATDSPSNASDLHSEDCIAEDGEGSEKEEKEKEKKSEYEDALLGSQHSLPCKSSVVRAYFHHHCAVLTCIIIDKPTQPPKSVLTA